jgi:hypothetical protein
MQCGLAERSPLTGIHTTSNSSPLGPSLDLVGATTVPRSHLPDVCMSSERLALTATNLPTVRFLSGHLLELLAALLSIT